MKEKPVLPLVLSMALPMTISMLVNALYNIVDSYFVAKISEDAMTALSLVFPVQNIVNAVSVGFGIGINAVIAYHLGAQNKQSANKAASCGFLFNIFHGIILTAVLILTLPKFLSLFTGNESVAQNGITYGNIVLSFSIVYCTSISFEKIFQAVGEMKVSMICMIIGCVTNIILDPVLIFGLGPFPKMEIKGAAIATIIGQGATLVGYLAFYAVKKIPVKIKLADMKPDKQITKRLYSIGIPATLNMALPSVQISALNGILAAFSQSYVLVLGAYYKLQTFLYLTANGVVQGMRPVIGYNYGAGETKRVKKIFETALGIIAVVMTIGTVLCLAIPQNLIGLFSTNPDTIEIGKTALRIISIGFIISSVSVTVSGALEGLGKGTESLIISILRYIAVMLTSAFVLSKIFGAIGVWHGFWITEFIVAAISILIYKKAVNFKKKSI